MTCWRAYMAFQGLPAGHNLTDQVEWLWPLTPTPFFKPLWFILCPQGSSYDYNFTHTTSPAILQSTLLKTAYFEKLSLFLKLLIYSCSPTSYDSESPKIMFIGGELVKLWGSQLRHSNFDFSPKKAATPRLLQTAVNVIILPPEHVQDRSGTG